MCEGVRKYYAYSTLKVYDIYVDYSVSGIMHRNMLVAENII